MAEVRKSTSEIQDGPLALDEETPAAIDEALREDEADDVEPIEKLETCYRSGLVVPSLHDSSERRRSWRRPETKKI
jgi:hypothetical protein